MGAKAFYYTRLKVEYIYKAFRLKDLLDEAVCREKVAGEFTPYGDYVTLITY